MAIYETFSKRQKKLLKQGNPDPYRYDIFPKPLCVQVIKLLNECLGNIQSQYDTAEARRWGIIHDTLAHEYGRFELASGRNDQVRCHEFLLITDKVEECLDFIEIGFRVVQQLAGHYSQKSGAYAQEQKQCEDAIQELNYRLREHGLGYQFESGELIKVDSQFIHAEVVKPALGLLHEFGFQGASEEFLQAHEHYRANRNGDAIAGALKAFESTMKAICNVRGWTYASSITAKGLIDLLMEKGLIPTDLASQFTALRSLLESGLPTVRNKAGGHGQGKDPIPIPPHITSFALHMAASNIVFLLEAHKALK